MKFITTLGALILSATLGSSLAAAAQTSVAPPPKPVQAQAAPSLADTMQFIINNMNSIGSVNFVVFSHNTADNSDFTSIFSYDYSNFRNGNDACYLKYFVRATLNGNQVLNGDNGFSFKYVEDVVVQPMEVYQRKVDADLGNPNLIANSTNPPMTALIIHERNNISASWIFSDPVLADRVAKAFTHATELCGGGQKKEPF